MLDYKLLEALAAVVDEGGFERAARVLHVTQSAVSQRVRQLEERMGQVLLSRKGGPEPTEAGRRLLKHFRQVRLLEEDLFKELVPGRESGFASLPIGVNADSLATWFLPALTDFLARERILLDLRVDDQEATHDLLRHGEVLGCVSTEPDPMQGCTAEYLGHMDYLLVGEPGFAAQWLPRGLDREAASRAPILAFNRKDTLHHKLFRRVLGEIPGTMRVSYLPSSEKFVDMILCGRACGMLPRQQCGPHLASGEFLDLAPGHLTRADLYWHCWNLDSPMLASLSRALLQGARSLLEPED